ncbi:MAG: hypothetical protein K0Q56_1849 [Sporolactobacillus laevolacticus]|nr:hypothetical protein [Sporolactobacillus laevolacticus]
MNFQPYAISQSQMIGTYAPEQILRGKVLDILPDRTALVQLGAKQVVAKVASIEPPLKVGQDYLFQIQQGSSNPLLAKVVNRKPTVGVSSLTMAEDVLTALNLKNEPLNRKIIQSFLDPGDPISRDAILQARALLKTSGDFPKDMQTIRWLINRQLPLTETFFQTAKDSASSEPLSAKLDTILREIKNTTTQTATIEKLKASLTAFSESNKADGLAAIFTRVGQDKGDALLKSFIKGQIPESQFTQSIQIKIDSFLSGSFSLKETTALLKDLNINRSPQSFIESFQRFVTGHIQESVSQLGTADHRDLLLQTLKLIGFDYEHQIAEWFNNGPAPGKSNSLKENLLAVVQDQQAPFSLRKMAHEMVQKITGEQIQMVSADPFVAQFAFQIPIPFQKELTNVSIYWEGKRDRKGTLDPDSCTILLWLELDHLKETLISVRVQNHNVALTIQNNEMDLRSWLKSGEPLLKDRLKENGYQLVSLTQTDKIDQNLVKKASGPLTESNYRLDVKV